MSIFLQQLLLVATVHLLAVMSPGPDFIMVSRNSLMYTRKVGIYSAIGLALGILVHVTYSLVGIGFIISRSIILFSVIKLLGAAYLLYIGYHCLKAQPVKQAADSLAPAKQQMSPLQAIKMGFLTNALNPKASLFFLAVFTQVISADTPGWIKVIYGIEMSTATFLWFALVALVLSHSVIQRRFSVIQHYVERVFGVILIGLGIKVALSSK